MLVVEGLCWFGVEGDERRDCERSPNKLNQIVLAYLLKKSIRSVMFHGLLSLTVCEEELCGDNLI